MRTAISCILCNSSKTEPFLEADGYEYLICSNCDLIFVRPGQRLTPDEEKSRYDQHENDPDDPDYREFLSQLFKPLQKLLKPGSHGLDFGSGPGPTLSLMFEEAGHTMNIYDPFYAPDNSVFDKQYDFITTTETAEHLFDPGSEFDRLWECLKPHGFLGVMTKFVPSHDRFKNWHYRRDDTHVAFYSEKTFRWMADNRNASLKLVGDRVAIFQKKG
ncbi:class I SAM-dependent methyltransferase [Rhodohalobacter mucosus]|uniref:Methyltransferase n=1 Tax=Rhodohalobacter mucosus TaxID=2079485 RepID=A0A316TQH2_9BACT|nr:class I SAM-dependent methyltransferase [Rhodohalobacter mucosus]PWN06650.1 methyltransferase [Rhodohalobacter mucosus]